MCSILLPAHRINASFRYIARCSVNEYLNKEKGRWILVLGDVTLVDSYLRLLAIACAIGYFNITDVYGDNYLEDDGKKLSEFFDNRSGKPGADNVFADLFVHMDELLEDDGEDPIAEVFAYRGTVSGRLDEEEITPIMEMDDSDRFAYYTPYIKLHSDPQEVYLNMLVNAGATTDEEIEELKRIQEERIRRVDALPDHAWIIEPVFPDIIKEFIVDYVVNDRDVVRFTKLARSNSILGLADFITRALDDWKTKSIFQKMAVTPPAEMLNHFEYYISLLIKLYDVKDIKTVEQALLDSDPCFPKYEMELWRRISVVLADRDDVSRLYDSGCRFIEYIKNIDGMVHIRDEVADAIEGYCVGLHNAEDLEKHSDYLSRCEEIAQLVPENKRIGAILCENCSMLVKAKLFHDNTTDVSHEWQKIMELIKRYGYPEAMCKDAMPAAHEYMITLIRKDDLSRLQALESQIEELYRKHNVVEIAEAAALCAANVYSISYQNIKKALPEEYEKLKLYLAAFPDAMRVRSAFVAASNHVFAQTSGFRKVSDRIISDAKAWSLQYPGEIEFQEGYFGLLLSRLEYAQAQDMRNEQRRVFREMKEVAERANYDDYHEQNQLMNTIELLHQIYGY